MGKFFYGKLTPNKSDNFITLKQKSRKSNSAVHKVVLLIDLQHCLQWPGTTGNIKGAVTSESLVCKDDTSLSSHTINHDVAQPMYILRHRFHYTLGLFV